MNKLAKFTLLILTNAIFITSNCLCAFETISSQQNENQSALSRKISETLISSEDLPGLKSEEFSTIKPELVKIWGTLIENGVLEVRGKDRDVRPYFVALQGVIEHVLSSELQHEIKGLRGFIHTPMPATPLCTHGEISKELVDPSIESDPLRLFTVKARTTIIRDYLYKGGDLYIVYPKDGLKKRTKQQLTIYQEELANYPKNLFDLPLNSENIPTELIGATYIFEDQSGKSFAFSIKMTQAKDPEEIGNFGLWFGPTDHISIQNRIKSISNYMKQSDSQIEL